MKKQHFDHVLRVAGRITGARQFIVFNRELVRRGIVDQHR
jgi:hypothetical protein